jgi:quinoprotein relay system zinc metallohydrolase 2
MVTIFKKTIALGALLIAGLADVALAESSVEPPPKIEPLPMKEVAPGDFVFEGAYQLFTPQNNGAVCNVSFVIGREAVAVIDTGGSRHEGERLKAAIRARTQLPIRYVINTHMHPDHIFGDAAFLGEGATFIGHEKLPRALAARGELYIKNNRPLLGDQGIAGVEIVSPQETVAAGAPRDIDLGGRVLRLTAHPTAHTDNDMTVMDLETSTLFLGDLLFVRHVPALDGSIKGWLEATGALRQVKAARAVPGHGPAVVAWPDALEPQEKYLGKVLAQIRALIKQGKDIAEAARTVGVDERDAWALFDEFNARNASAAFAELEWE